jgi:hypothetical protein
VKPFEKKTVVEKKIAYRQAMQAGMPAVPMTVRDFLRLR